MQLPPIPDNEAQRLEALHRLELLDTLPETAFDQLTELAARVFDVPVVLVTLVDTARQWFKSAHGLDCRETSRDVSFCAHAVAADQQLIVEDAHADSRFADNPLVLDDPHIRFYAGQPLRTAEGQPIGTLCLIDRRPRELDAGQRECLTLLAAQAEELIRLHLAHLARRDNEYRLQRQRALLKVLHQGITDYRALMSGERLWHFLLEALRELTQSDYALIGEVLYDDNTPALKIHAITDLSWSDESRRLMERLQSGDMLLGNPDSLLGRAFAHGDTVITDDLANHPRCGGFPPGHPPLYNYLGVPIVHDGRVIGMYATANSAEGYSPETVEWLEPFNATCALLINLYRQFSERDRIERDIAQARDLAESASRAKSEFLSAMSHELRTPLNAILGFAQLLASGRRDPLSARQQRQIAQIRSSGEHLLTLINDILDLARIEAGHMTLSLEPVCLAAVCREAMETLEPLARDADIALQAPALQGPTLVRADATRLKQVLLNLLSNAIKYNRPQGRVALAIEVHADTVRLSVEDTGSGVDAERLDELFEPFNRLGAESSAIEGTGIGLALTRQLVERMHGRIGVNSEPGRGSRFWFELERAIDDAPAATDEACTPAPLTATPPRRVLYIEDNPANQRLMEDLFDEFEGLSLYCAPTAELGIDLAASLRPDLILMDIHLPGMNGHAACKALASRQTTRDIPVIALSANAMATDIHHGMAAGFRVYLTKPVEIDALRAAITACFMEDASNA
ncbi:MULTISPECIES: GAF domain-containing protein [unclassified Modicisalibacter]|uniref:GAF domain-containing protein n=1 Tax=unclassified Modicisalibacter TaxID=2679913 RepID=UPI001CCCDD1E|nr:MULTISPECIES: GAF domain-containing protein [unclassified Modicisalibacter]MBZ9559956.1 GAF domain-containing protein [Modicisalibacter sp. R2A 31.J]MBZ9575864.1 GAF domain-containing protein [Modicisalibacter sp. MOD 31.J]